MFIKIMLVIVFLSLFSCSLTPYKVKLKQGSQVTQRLHDNLKLGMSKEEVINLLGSPNIHSVYSPNRFDYVYMYNKESKYFSSSYYVIFNNNVVIYISNKKNTELDIDKYNNYQLIK